MPYCAANGMLVAVISIRDELSNSFLERRGEDIYVLKQDMNVVNTLMGQLVVSEKYFCGLPRYGKGANFKLSFENKDFHPWGSLTENSELDVTTCPTEG